MSGNILSQLTYPASNYATLQLLDTNLRRSWFSSSSCSAEYHSCFVMRTNCKLGPGHQLSMQIQDLNEMKALGVLASPLLPVEQGRARKHMTNDFVSRLNCVFTEFTHAWPTKHEILWRSSDQRRAKAYRENDWKGLLGCGQGCFGLGQGFQMGEHDPGCQWVQLWSCRIGVHHPGGHEGIESVQSGVHSLVWSQLLLVTCTACCSCSAVAYAKAEQLPHAALQEGWYSKGKDKKRQQSTRKATSRILEMLEQGLQLKPQMTHPSPNGGSVKLVSACRVAQWHLCKHTPVPCLWRNMHIGGYQVFSPVKLPHLPTKHLSRAQAIPGTNL